MSRITHISEKVSSPMLQCYISSIMFIGNTSGISKTVTALSVYMTFAL